MLNLLAVCESQYTYCTLRNGKALYRLYDVYDSWVRS